MTLEGPCGPTAGMANVLGEEKREQILALGRLGWSLRRIEREIHVRRETAGLAASPRQSENWDGPYFGADWGFSTDPTVLLKMWVHNKRLHIEHEAYKVGCDIVDTPKLFDTVPGSRRYVVRADCARPETIHHVQRAGFRIEAATKWPKSVEDGITLLRSFEKIVIHPRCKNMIQEARLYSYKTDKLTGDVLPDIIDRHNHCWDAARYGLLPLIRRRPTVFRGAVEAPWRWC